MLACVFMACQTFSHLFSLTRSLSGFKLLSIVESDGKIGDVGTGMGRVEFSICKTIDEEPTQPSEQEGYEVNAYTDMAKRF